jgi:hypothetical protein
MIGAVRLARWLGPWTRPTTLPPRIQRSEVRFGDNDKLRALRYEAVGSPRGAYLMAPGLHPLGPEHPVLDRFCRILAASGFLVLSPELPDHRLTLLTDAATDQLGQALRALRRAVDGQKPAIFAVSFGVLPAMRIASDPAYQNDIAGLLLYGGHADFSPALTYLLTGTVDGCPVHDVDPRLGPVPLMNLPHLPCPEALRPDLHRAWLSWMSEVWILDGKDPAPWWERAVAHEATLPESLRPLFRIGVGLEPGVGPLVEEAVTKDPEFARKFSPTTYAPGVTQPVIILHGADDPVIHVSQADRLRDALAPHTQVERYVTGLYGHTKLASVGEMLQLGGAIVSELLTAGRVVSGIERLARPTA